jgi:hypothetical protein
MLGNGDLCGGGDLDPFGWGATCRPLEASPSTEPRRGILRAVESNNKQKTKMTNKRR